MEIVGANSGASDVEGAILCAFASITPGWFCSGPSTHRTRASRHNDAVALILPGVEVKSRRDDIRQRRPSVGLCFHWRLPAFPHGSSRRNWGALNSQPAEEK